MRTAQTDTAHLITRANTRNAKAAARPTAPKDSVSEIVHVPETTPDEATAAARYITRRAGTDAGELLDMLGLTEPPPAEIEAEPAEPETPAKQVRDRARCTTCNKSKNLRKDGLIVAHPAPGNRWMSEGACAGGQKHPKGQA